MVTVIDEFLRQYEREYDYYFGVARFTARRCELSLSEAGIRHLVTFRAKRVDRLREKLFNRNEETPYGSIEAIRQDIVDLAGVRVALFFPGDQKTTESFIENSFSVEDNGRKTFPSPNRPQSYSSFKERFVGYCATHYRVRNRIGELPQEELRYADARVEIQVASVLMLAWQEVHHDLGYKPLSGDLSDDERAILDEVNGLVIAGEVAFERLQRAVERRLSEQDEAFANHYDLASYLEKRARTRKESP